MAADATTGMTPGRRGRQWLPLLPPLLPLLAAVGCSTPHYSNTARTAREQLLLSAAADRAAANLALPKLSHRQVHLDLSNLEAIDRGYAAACLRARLAAAGAVLVETPADADLILEARCGALGTDMAQTMWGLPSIALPVPLVGTVQTPELALLKITRQTGHAKFTLSEIPRDGEEPTPPPAGVAASRTYHTRWLILIVGFTTTNVPELK
ncbi:MAG: DUF6655 family protein [Lentisphaeria bacterium]|jgi:hypothetical protein